MPQQLFVPITQDQIPPYSQAGVSQQPSVQVLSNGMVSYVADYLRDQSSAKLMVNLLQSRKQGVWTSRDNGIARYDSHVYNAGATLSGFGSYFDVNNVQNLVFQAAANLYAYNFSTKNATAILTGGHSGIPTFRQFQPNQAGATTVTIGTYQSATQAGGQPIKIIQAGTASTFGLNGGTVSAHVWGATAAPLAVKTYSQPAFCEAFLNRMAYGGFQDTTLPANYYDVLITNAGLFDTVSQNSTLEDTDGVVVQVPAICGRITSLKSVQLSNQNNAQALMIGCQNGVCLVQGTGALSFGVVVLTLQFGIPSNQALMQVSNDVIFLATDGIRAFSSLVINANLITSALSYGIQDVIQTLDQANLQYAFVCGNRNTKDIQFWLPQLGPNNASSNGVCNLAIVMNYGNSSSGVASIPGLNFNLSLREGMTQASAIEFQDPNNNYQWTMFGGGYNGVLYTHYTGNLNDKMALPWVVTFPLASATNNPATGFSVRKISIITEGPGAENYYAACGFLEMMANGTLLRQQNSQGAFNLQTPTVSTTILGTWVLGQSAFPSNFTQLAEFEPTGEGRFMELQLTGYNSSNVIDLIGAHYILSSGGTRR
jgi:hypothetical protein